VLTLDVEMPRMNGLEFLEKLMRLRPMPVLMVSTLTERGNEVTLKALELGAVDFITNRYRRVRWPHRTGQRNRRQDSRRRACPRPPPCPGHEPGGATATAGRAFPQHHREDRVRRRFHRRHEALKEFLSRMPATSPAVMITQHMPETFTRSFAQRLDGLSAMIVKEAEHNVRWCRAMPTSPWTFPSAAEEKRRLLLHRAVESRPGESPSPLGGRAVPQCRPGGRAEHAGCDHDRHGQGRRPGLLALRKSGAYTIAQDEASCVVFGMPKAAIEIGAAVEVASLNDLAGRVLDRLGRRG